MPDTHPVPPGSGGQIGYVSIQSTIFPKHFRFIAIIWKKGYRGQVSEWECKHTHRSAGAATRCAKQEEKRRASV